MDLGAAFSGSPGSQSGTVLSALRSCGSRRFRDPDPAQPAHPIPDRAAGMGW
jgi:hypothetical protein